jgi:hypothetical protein
MAPALFRSILISVKFNSNKRQVQTKTEGNAKLVLCKTLSGERICK